MTRLVLPTLEHLNQALDGLIMVKIAYITHPFLTDHPFWHIIIQSSVTFESYL